MCSSESGKDSFSGVELRLINGSSESSNKKSECSDDSSKDCNKNSVTQSASKDSNKDSSDSNGNHGTFIYFHDTINHPFSVGSSYHSCSTQTDLTVMPVIKNQTEWREELLNEVREEMRHLTCLENMAERARFCPRSRSVWIVVAIILVILALGFLGGWLRSTYGAVHCQPAASSQEGSWIDDLDTEHPF